jgi:hypothetical protein
MVQIPSNFNHSLLTYSNHELIAWAKTGRLARPVDSTMSASTSSPVPKQAASQPKFAMFRKWRLTMNFKFKFMETSNGYFVLVGLTYKTDTPSRGVLDRLHDSAEYIRTILNNPHRFEENLYSELNSKIYMFVDISNIMGASQRRLNAEGKLFQDESIRLNVAQLDYTVAGLRHVKCKHGVGSIKEHQTMLNAPWIANGYSLHMEVRGSDNTEVSVDSKLVCLIQNELLKSYEKGDNVKKRFVILTGDGNVDEREISIRDVIRRVLKAGHFVDLYSWKLSIHSVYERWAVDPEFKQNFRVIYLDDFRSNITFHVRE